MRITIVPTEKILSLTDLERHEFPRMVRMWEGITDSGVTCAVFVSGIAVELSQDQTAFEKELRKFVPRDTCVEVRHML